tara:strand:- start:19303 stop:19512 length:210 start_codon:yes stop_codon:yes gene_type:complete
MEALQHLVPVIILLIPSLIPGIVSLIIGGQLLFKRTPAERGDWPCLFVAVGFFLTGMAFLFVDGVVQNL